MTTRKSQLPIKQFVTNQAKTHTKQRDKSPGRKPVEFCPLKKRMGWATIDRDGDIHNECYWV